MTVPYTKYLEVKDKCCLSYFGEDKQKINRLLELRKSLKEKYKGMKFYLALKDNAEITEENVIFESELSHFASQFGYSIELEENNEEEFFSALA